MPKFTRKPTTIEAIQFKGSYREDKELMKKLSGVRYSNAGYDNLTLYTATGKQYVMPGDYVIFGTHDVYPCRADVFEATYEPAIEA